MNKVPIYRVTVWVDANSPNSHWVQTAQQLDIRSLMSCHQARLFFIQGNLSTESVQRLSNILADPVTETFTVSLINSPDNNTSSPIAADHTIDVTLRPGVTDPVAENLTRAMQLLGEGNIERAATGQRYLLQGDLSEQELHTLATKVFSNSVIQCFEVNRPIAPPFVHFEQNVDIVETVPVREADDNTLTEISTTRTLALNLHEMKALQTYFLAEERDPTDIELEMLAQTWSEHCIHKTFRANIHYTGPIPGKGARTESVEQTIDGLLKTYIRGATEQLKKPWIRSTFVDNAGIIAFDDEWDLAFKLETHNHPSAIEPFGGANTGVGGVVRDVLGVSARPIANTDVLCFGPQELPAVELTEGTLHPRRIAAGVIHGIEDYGNKMGIPTVNGAILYHPGYTANPLVFCGCLGLLPRDSHPTEPQPGDFVIVIGGRTGRDGLHGATFSSMEMDQTTEAVSGGAVQIGHPINEKQVLEVVLQARDKRLYNAITDCGAGGLSSAVGEMSSNLGARVQLEAVPLKYPGLHPWEIWLSEAQERMVMAVSPENWLHLQSICEGQNVEAVCIGEFEATGRLKLFYNEHMVGDLSVDFLHNGIPQRQMRAVWEASPQPAELNLSEPFDLSDTLLALLKHPNIQSKEAVVRRYDHEVQGGTVVKPLTGVAEHGPSDATVLVPLDTSPSDSTHWPKGVALSVGIAPRYGEIDPYAMAWAAVDEAMRNVVAVGADPDQVALLDNFCWGNPDLPDRLGSLVRCSQGCYDAALAYAAPFISGKDSLNNEYSDAEGRRLTIPGTLLISALAIVPTVQHTVTLDLKQAGNILYVIGETRSELGGSHYILIQDIGGGEAPQPITKPLDRLRALHKAIQAGLVQACHDCSEGGIGVALAEMCIAGRRGADLQLAHIPTEASITRDDVLLFSESIGRFVVEVKPEDAAAFEAQLDGIAYAHVGQVRDDGMLYIYGSQGTCKLRQPTGELEKAWRGSAPTQTTRPTPRHTSQPAVAMSHTNPPKVIVLHANGTNRDREAVQACELAGAEAEIVHINQLTRGEKHLLDYHMMVIPGGFSYGDDLGAGALWALDLQYRLGDEMARFVESGRPVLGICNGFQALVKSGFLPGPTFDDSDTRLVTLATNESGQFECRWVYLRPNTNSPCLFTEDLDDLIYCPVAHKEGNFIAHDKVTLEALTAGGLVALTYVKADGSAVGYPGNPNGSQLDIAGICNPNGNVLGLMPHPENHLFPWQYPRWHRNEAGLTGLRLFENGVRHAKK
jgi:phosphoribosylformylglycinamidine synthase